MTDEDKRKAVAEMEETLAWALQRAGVPEKQARAAAQQMRGHLERHLNDAIAKTRAFAPKEEECQSQE